ncbi:MAG: Lipopolysaccharide export system protein LptA [Deltaproteobacteria bacterium]|jgi:lipopolysaccharide transport protein LptA|nr:Lipopolysaccharide export system protein LptA [Deltaproteobacteria bacterium]
MKILFSILLSFSIFVIEPLWNLNKLSHAFPSTGYKVTNNTLDHLRREGFSNTLIAELTPLLDKNYKNRNEFIGVLPIQLTVIEQEILLRYASTEQIKIQAEEFSSDLKENAAVFRGNVKGVIPRENIELTTAKLRLVSGKDTNFEKLIGEGGVQVKQWDREVRSDFAIYTQVDLEAKADENETAEIIKMLKPQQTLQMQGNVIMKADQGNILSDNVLLDLLNQHATLEGQDTSKEGRIRVEANLSDLETNRGKTDSDLKSEESKEEQPENAEPRKVLLLASRAVLDNKKHQAMFEGNVEMERTPDNLYIHAGKITLHLNEAQELQFMQAVQEVCFEQPGRVAKADQASFDEITQTILLEGSAEVQSGQYHLQGNTINLYLDVNKGLAQGDNKAPIQMTILGEQSPAIFACR